MEINEYIESGILEAYVLGSASDKETRELLQLRTRYAEVDDALLELELDLERIAQHMAITPPPTTWLKVEDSINEIVRSSSNKLKVTTPAEQKTYNPNADKAPSQFIEVEGASSHMRIHKLWRWVFAAVFVLGKIFLGFAIYFYLENRQMNIQMKELKSEIQHIRSK
ncbi:hypothetical protein [Pedobacter duraquae]|uniref:Uncharacterized protein n=1 Tax=Pedobacter duraquae TaxID=425511 RepID=A0A4R6IQ34_9SPHI|nr:hypothetical protein [Pedobacter duraquae]TDO24430.1 hypothetical protein CLV32_0719 [Pedobacter duraquae]